MPPVAAKMVSFIDASLVACPERWRRVHDYDDRGGHNVTRAGVVAGGQQVAGLAS
jgi:hypothetical protein